MKESSINAVLAAIGAPPVAAPVPAAERIARCRKFGIDEQFLNEADIPAVEQYLAGARRCAVCTSLEECESPYGGHEPVLRRTATGRAVMLLRPCKKLATRNEQLEHDENLKIATVPLGYAQMGFRGFRVGEGSSDAMAACLRLATGKSRGLILWGPTGTGKTHLAVATLRNWMEGGRTGAYLSAPDAVDRMRGDFGEAAAKVLESVGSVGLLVIDDLGAERKTDYVVESIFRIVDRRMASALPVVVTTNYSPVELARRYGGVEGERIVSRLSGLGDWIEVQGEDGRTVRSAP